MELDLHGLIGLHFTWCAQLFSLAKTIEIDTQRNSRQKKLKLRWKTSIEYESGKCTQAVQGFLSGVLPFCCGMSSLLHNILAHVNLNVASGKYKVICWLISFSWNYELLVIFSLSFADEGWRRNSIFLHFLMLEKALKTFSYAFWLEPKQWVGYSKARELEFAEM